MLTVFAFLQHSKTENIFLNVNSFNSVKVVDILNVFCLSLQDGTASFAQKPFARKTLDKHRAMTQSYVLSGRLNVSRTNGFDQKI